MATSAQDLWWESCFSNSTAIASTLARKTQRKWCWSWRAGTSTKQAIPLFFALMHRSEKNETAFPPQRHRRNEPSLIWPPVETSRLADHFYCRNFVAWGHYIVAACGHYQSRATGQDCGHGQVYPAMPSYMPKIQ